MDPPIKLFGQTIAFTTSVSLQGHAQDGAGTKSTGAWEELSSSPQDVLENGAESGARSEVNLSACQASCFPELSSSGSNGADEEKFAPLEVYGLILPSPEAARCRAAEDSEDIDVEDLGLGNREGTMSQEVRGDDDGNKGPKLPRRPDKAVTCPRCHSLETKFCYYNNYNVNQPRHFCKHCQRYWTAGGTLRNVPVGAGRRKNKHGSVISPRQSSEMGFVRGDEPDVAAPLSVGKGIAVPVPMQVPVVQNVVGGTLACSAESIGRVPVAGGSPDHAVTLPYTMRLPSLEATYILTSSEAVKSSDSGVPGGNQPCLATAGFNEATGRTNDLDGSRAWHSKAESSCASFSGSCGSSLFHHIKGESGPSPGFDKEVDVTAAWSSGGPGTSHGAAGPFGFFNGGWPYGYNVGWSGGAAFCGVASGGNVLPPTTPASIAAWSSAAAGSMWTGMPWPMPGLAWSPAGWGPPWSVGPWAMGAAAAGATVPTISIGGTSGLPASILCPTGSASSFSTGKHSRPFEGVQVEGEIWAPKSLRMADPEEALRSSVWRILGVGSSSDLTTASSFKAFQPKAESKKIACDEEQTVQATLHANPAAMSRSMDFHESS